MGTKPTRRQVQAALAFYAGQEIADRKEQSTLAGEAKPLERAQKNLQGINADMKEISRAADLTPEEKRQRLDTLTIERNALLKAAVEDAKAAQETDNQTLRGARK